MSEQLRPLEIFIRFYFSPLSYNMTARSSHSSLWFSLLLHSPLHYNYYAT